MNIKEARLLQARMKQELSELRSQRERVSVVEMLPEEDFHDYINDTPEELSERIDTLIEKILSVESGIRRANSAPMEIPDYPEIKSLGELVGKVIQLRQEAKYYRNTAAKPKREKSFGFNSSDATVRVTTINHDWAVERSDKLTLEWEKMSLLIEKLDLSIEVDCKVD